MPPARLFTARTTGGEAAIDEQAHVHGLHAHLDGAGEGQIVLRDGGASGTVRATFDTPAVDEPYHLPFPGYVEFDTNVYVELTNVNQLTLFWR